MTFLLSAKVTNQHGDPGEGWWIVYLPLTPENLERVIDGRKIDENLSSVIPIYLYDFGSEDDDG